MGQWRGIRQAGRADQTRGVPAIIDDSGCVEHTRPPSDHSSVCVPCVIAPPARSAAATRVVSASSCSVAPAFFAFWAWISMQYGHCVVSATATAISSLYLSGITPPLKAASSKATKLLKASGASSPSFLNFFRLAMSYIVVSWNETSATDCLDDVGPKPQGRCRLLAGRGQHRPGVLLVNRVLPAGLPRRVVENMADREDVHLASLAFVAGVDAHHAAVATGAGVEVDAMDSSDLGRVLEARERDEEAGGAVVEQEVLVAFERIGVEEEPLAAGEDR